MWWGRNKTHKSEQASSPMNWFWSPSPDPRIRLNQETIGPCQGYVPERAVAPHSSTLAWKIPWMEEPGRLQSMGSLRVGYDWVSSLSLFTCMHWRRKWQPTPVFLPGESQGWGSLVAVVYGVTQSRTRLKWLSSSSSKHTENCSGHDDKELRSFHRVDSIMHLLISWSTHIRCPSSGCLRDRDQNQAGSLCGSLQTPKLSNKYRK